MTCVYIYIYIYRLGESGLALESLLQVGGAEYISYNIMLYNII